MHTISMTFFFNDHFTVALKDERDRKRCITDIDSSQFLTSSYDPAYAWSIWMQQKKVEVKATKTYFDKSSHIPDSSFHGIHKLFYFIQRIFNKFYLLPIILFTM